MKENLILKKALESGLIDYNAICNQLEAVEREECLNDYKYSIWQGNNGKWYTKLPTSDGKRRLIKRNTRKEIEDAIFSQGKENVYPSTIDGTFRAWVQEKLDRAEICKGTYDRYCNEFERYFAEIKDIQIGEMTENDIDEFIRESIADKQLTAKQYSNMRTIILGIFRYAKKHRYTNISIGTFFKDFDLSRKVFTKKKRRDEVQIFSEEETELVEKWLSDNPTVENLGILLVFQTGLREGELSALKFSDVDGNQIHIQRQEIKYKAEKGKVVHEIVEYTKTDHGDRYIFIPDEAKRTIDRLRELNPDNDYMMVNSERKVLTNTFNDRLYRACDEVGIERRSMHKIRKTYGTMLIDNGVDDSLIQKQMGHSDIETTRKYYYYSRANDDRKLEQIQGCFRGNPKKVTK